MTPDEKAESRLTSLNAYRDSLRKREYIRRSVEKTASLRSLLNEAIAAYNKGCNRDRQIIAFALNDVLRNIPQGDMDYLSDVLRRISTQTPYD